MKCESIQTLPSHGLQSGEILKQAIEERCKKNPSYSLRAAARDLGVSHGYLSLIIHGKKRLNFQRALQISQFLKMDEVRSQLFLRAVALESMKNLASRAYIENSLSGETSEKSREFATLELDRFRILSEWYHIAILDLTLLKQFKPDSFWVASELGITVDQVKSAIARLERLGLLEVTHGKWKKTTAKLFVPTTHSDRAIRNFHEQMIEKAQEALNSPDPEDFLARDISGITFVADPAKMPEAKKLVEKFKRQMLELMGSGESNALYQMNVQVFQLNKTKPKEYKKGVKK